MDHADHVALLRAGIEAGRRGSGAVWADIGSGRGAFTLALADLLGAGAEVIAVDRDGGGAPRMRPGRRRAGSRP